MAEQITLNAPIAKPSVTDYRIGYFAIDVSNQRLIVELVANDGTRLMHVWEEAGALIGALNVANLTTKSLERRIYERLIADGVLAGAVTGTP
jgi:hypothetical protein